MYQILAESMHIYKTLIENSGNLWPSAIDPVTGEYDPNKDELAIEDQILANKDTKKQWPSYVPQSEIDFIVGRYHVGTPDEKIAEIIRKKLSKGKGTPEQIQTCVDYALSVHHEYRQLYQDVMGGKI